MKAPETNTDIFRSAAKKGIRSLLSPKFGDTELGQWNAKQLHAQLRLAYNQRQSLLIYGEPGLGKSSHVLFFANNLAPQIPKANGNGFRTFVDNDQLNDAQRADVIKNAGDYFMFVDIRVSSMEPSDLKGIPNLDNSPDKIAEYLRYHKPSWVVWGSHPDAAGVLFFDEMNQGTREVLNAMYSVILDRKVADNKFNDKIGIFAAGNLADGFNNVNPLPLALVNRFSAGVLTLDVPGWVQYAKNANINWTIIAFVEAFMGDSNAGVLFKKPKEAEMMDPFPTPRSLVTFSNSIYAVDNEYQEAVKNKKDINEEDFLSTIYEKGRSLCGNAWADKFITFLENLVMFDMDYVYHNRRQLIQMSRGKDVRNVTHLSALVYFLSNQMKRFMEDIEEKVDVEKSSMQLGRISEIVGELDEEWLMQIRSALVALMPEEFDKKEDGTIFLKHDEGFIRFAKLIKTLPKVNSDAKDAFFKKSLPIIQEIADAKKRMNLGGKR